MEAAEQVTTHIKCDLQVSDCDEKLTIAAAGCFLTLQV
jgi:hypothetical protein